MKSIARWMVVVVMFMVSALPAAAQGPVVEPPPQGTEAPVFPITGNALQLLEQRVEVMVEGQVATTRLTQNFRNVSEWALEGEYLFPLPPDAAIQDMDMTVNGERLEGELMDVEQATQIYEEIVRQRMDPALLQWLGNGLFRTRIFPIPPGETRLIEMEYSQLLTAEGGLFNYRFPLRQMMADTAEVDASVSVSLRSEVPLRALYSPSHDVDIIRDGEQAAIVGWEGQGVPLAEDFSLFWSVSPEEIELNLLSFKEAGEDGFFLLLAAPTIDPPSEEIVARDVVVVLDVSGSMEGEKMAQAKGALDFVLSQLNPEDRFNVIAFSTGTRPFAQRLQSTSEVPAAQRWVEELEASGSTDIGRALSEAMAQGEGAERPFYLLFLTDGLPTAGVTASDQLLRLAEQNAPEGLRLFTFGVGYDVDTVLLDSLAEEMRGAASYVTPDERIDEEVSAFYEAVSAPVLADVSVDWGDTLVEELYPAPLPDLFAGQQLVVAGRYREGGPVALTLEGTVNGQPQTFSYDDLRLARDDESEEGWLPRLWATRKIGALLKSIRQQGENQEAVDEIIDLAIRHGIVTPYTTFLVDEDQDIFDDAARENLESEAFDMATEASGAEAVGEAEMASEMADSESASMPSTVTETIIVEGGVDAVIRTAGAKSFVRRDGQWIDTRYEEGMALTEVPFGSEAYFELAGRSPETARALSVGTPLIVVVDGEAYEIVEPSESTSTVESTSTSVPPSVEEPNEISTASEEDAALLMVLLAVAVVVLGIGGWLALRRR